MNSQKEDSSWNVVIGLEQDMVCVGGVGAAIRHSMSEKSFIFKVLHHCSYPCQWYVSMRSDGTVIDVTIGKWYHNQPATNHDYNSEYWI